MEGKRLEGMQGWLWVYVMVWTKYFKFSRVDHHDRRFSL